MQNLAAGSWGQSITKLGLRFSCQLFALEVLDQRSYMYKEKLHRKYVVI